MVRVLLVASVAFVLAAAPVHASISPSATIEGPSAGVRDLGGVALAADGTGGLVYSRVDPADGRVHVYASRFSHGGWSVPQRVDSGQPFDSQWPRIAAATGGRLVVIWTQPLFAGQDALYSAALPRGAARFQAPTLVDYDIRTATNAAFPSLAMSRDGEALLAYRVVTTAAGDPTLPPGYVKAELRVARYDGTRWSVLASRANRNVNSPVRVPTAANGPRVAVDQNGNGSLAFQEPDDAFIDRVWVRRVFGTRLGTQVLASPQAYGDKSLNGGADAPALAESPLAAVQLAFRQSPGERSPLPGTRVMTNALPDAISDNAAVFTGPVLGDGLGRGDAPGDVGPPAVAINDDAASLLAYRANGAVSVVATDYAGRALPVQSLGASPAGPDPQVAFGSGDSGAVAWRAPAGIAVQQRVRGRAAGTSTVAAAGAGAPTALNMGDDGIGDALVAVRQEKDGAGTIAAAYVDAPPLRFGLRLPVDWQRGRQVTIDWDPATDAFGSVTYRVLVDGKQVVSTPASRVRLGAAELAEGRRSIRVIARDAAGADTEASAQTLKVDRRPPALRVIRRKGRRVELRVTDPGGRTASGVKAGSTSVTWGDGKRRAGAGSRASHRYARAEADRRVEIVAKVADRAGNRRTVTRRVRVR